MDLKRKLNILSLSLFGALWFAIAFQTVHSVEHLSDLLQEEQCHHKYDHAHTVISHGHHDFDDCFVCHHALSPYVLFDAPHFESTKIQNFVKNQFAYFEQIVTYSGSKQNTRAPPYFIV